MSLSQEVEQPLNLWPQSLYVNPLKRGLECCIKAFFLSRNFHSGGIISQLIHTMTHSPGCD